MFKLTRGGNGLRRSSQGAGGRPSRVSGLTQLRGSDVTLSQRRRPAFLPDTPEEQGWDSNTPRVNETA